MCIDADNCHQMVRLSGAVYDLDLYFQGKTFSCYVVNKLHKDNGCCVSSLSLAPLPPPPLQREVVFVNLIHDLVCHYCYLRDSVFFCTHEYVSYKWYLTNCIYLLRYL